MDKLAAMKTFITVVQKGGFSEAARALGIPKTRVSQRVQDLEGNLGVRLLHRTTRVVTPTEEGAVYFEKALHLVEELEDLERAMNRTGEQAVGRLNVTIISTLAHSLILPKLPVFLERFPEISIKVQMTNRLVNLQEENIDCAIRGGRLENSSMISRHVADVDFGLFAAPGFLRSLPRLAEPDDVDKADRIHVLSHRTGLPVVWNLAREGVEQKIVSGARFETDDDQAALAACLAGVGILNCPAFVAAPYTAAGKLVRVLPEWQTGTRPIYLVYPSKRYLAAKLRCFLDWAAETVQSSLKSEPELPA